MNSVGFNLGFLCLPDFFIGGSNLIHFHFYYFCIHMEFYEGQLDLKILCELSPSISIG